MTEELGFKIFANAHEAELALSKLERKYDNLEQGIKQTGRASRSVKDGAIAGMQNWAMGLARTAAGYLAITNILPQIISLERERLNVAREAERIADSAVRRLRVQGAMNVVQGEAARKSLEEKALRYGLPIENVESTLTQGISSGVAVKDALGGAGDELINMQAAMNQIGKDGQGVTRSLLKFLTTRGKELNAENIRSMSEAFFSSFLSSDVQLADLEAYTKVAGTFGDLPDRDMMGLLLFSQLDAGFNASEGSTKASSTFIKLQTSAGNKEAQKYAKQLGVDLDSFDFIGETLEEGVANFAAEMADLTEQQRAIMLKKLVGTENFAFAKKLLEDVEGKNMLNARINTPVLAEDYVNAIETATGGRERRSQRLKNQKDFNNRRDAEVWDDWLSTLDQMDIVLKERGYNLPRRLLATQSAKFARFESTEEDPEKLRRHGIAMGLPGFLPTEEKKALLDEILQRADEKKEGVKVTIVGDRVHAPARMGHWEN